MYMVRLRPTHLPKSGFARQNFPSQALPNPPPQVRLCPTNLPKSGFARHTFPGQATALPFFQQHACIFVQAAPQNSYSPVGVVVVGVVGVFVVVVAVVMSGFDFQILNSKSKFPMSRYRFST